MQHPTRVPWKILPCEGEAARSESLRDLISFSFCLYYESVRNDFLKIMANSPENPGLISDRGLIARILLRVYRDARADARARAQEARNKGDWNLMLYWAREVAKWTVLAAALAAVVATIT